MNSIVSAAAVASATAIPNPVRSAIATDPVFAAIERHKKAAKAVRLACDQSDRLVALTDEAVGPRSIQIDMSKVGTDQPDVTVSCWIDIENHVSPVAEPELYAQYVAELAKQSKRHTAYLNELAGGDIDALITGPCNEETDASDALSKVAPRTMQGLLALLIYIERAQKVSEAFTVDNYKSMFRQFAKAARAFSSEFADHTAVISVDDADRDLLEMGDEFDEVVKRVSETNARANELFEPIEEAIEAQATWPDDQRKWTREDAQSYLETRNRIINDVGAEWTAVMAELENVHHRRADELVRNIWKIPAHSMAGIGIKAKAAAFVCYNYWDEPFADLDWDHKGPRALIDAVLDVAGLTPAPEFLAIA